MDKFERMIIRSHTDWQAILRIGGRHLICPGCGETRPHAFPLHHVAGVKFGDETLPLCIICHLVINPRQATEHPPILDAAPTPNEKRGRFLLGVADVWEMQTDLMREIGEYLIALGQGRVPLSEG